MAPVKIELDDSFSILLLSPYYVQKCWSTNLDEEEQEQSPSKTNTRHSDNKTPVPNVTADNNFVHDDWDAEEEPTSQPTTKAAYSTVLTGGVAADANFVHDDWDD
ncbi:hypothetical protein F441_11880 [Phytophthora nicotianae CJ01A1]|uniref:Uncharacterized protein n=1 Tax=Phytophthora nicotianae CJ01A1 TaxID=1317063 RepID=W2WRK4_PHYNI|nr:hypothetical protein F441_11880 [Phytophthora nicotianae CJ01A1]